MEQAIHNPPAEYNPYIKYLEQSIEMIPAIQPEQLMAQSNDSWPVAGGIMAD